MPEPDERDIGAGAGNTRAIIDAARELREVRPEVIRPTYEDVVAYRDHDGTVQVLDVDDYLATPRRATGEHEPADVASLIALTKTLGDAASTTVWVHPTNGRVEVVFDDHFNVQDVDPQPGHGEHRARLQLLPSPEWKRWAAQDRRLLKQQEFADLIEDGIPDIAEPPGADLLEIASTLTGKTEVNWRGGVRLQDGTVTLKYDEESTASAGRQGDLPIPHHFTLWLAPFYGEERVTLTARLRYRLNGGDLLLGYVLDRPEDVVQRTITSVRDRLADEFERVYVGTPR